MRQQVLFLNLVFTADSCTVFFFGLLWKHELKLRNSHWSCSVKNSFLKNFENFTGKFKSLFNRVAGLQACNCIKKILQQRCFPVEFAKFLRTPILKNNCERLFLKPVLSPGIPFLVTYTSGSSWSLCFNFCIIIYSFAYQFLPPCCAAVISSSRLVVLCKISVFTNFSKFTRKHLRCRSQKFQI